MPDQKKVVKLPYAPLVWDLAEAARVCNGIVSEEKDYFYFGVKDLEKLEWVIRHHERAKYGL